MTAVCFSVARQHPRHTKKNFLHPPLFHKKKPEIGLEREKKAHHIKIRAYTGWASGSYSALACVCVCYTRTRAQPLAPMCVVDATTAIVDEVTWEKNLTMCLENSSSQQAATLQRRRRLHLTRFRSSLAPSPSLSVSLKNMKRHPLSLLLLLFCSPSTILVIVIDEKRSCCN